MLGHFLPENDDQPWDFTAPYMFRHTLVTYQRPAVDGQSGGNWSSSKDAQILARCARCKVCAANSERNYAKALPPEQIKDLDTYYNQSLKQYH